MASEVKRSDTRRDEIAFAARQAKIAAVKEKFDARIQAPLIQIKCDATGNLVSNYSDPDIEAVVYLLGSDLGSIDPRFISAAIQQIVRLGGRGGPAGETVANFAMAVVAAIKPRDEMETMLAMQMATIHTSMMDMAHQLHVAQTTVNQEMLEKSMNRLARTYAVQMDTLKRYRAASEHKMTVEQVTVNAGGQAIVGAVTTGMRETDEK